MSDTGNDTPANQGQGGTPNPAKGSDQEKLLNTADPAGSQDTSQGGEGGEDKQFSQAEVDLIVAKRLEREKAKAEKEAEKARKEAEMASLADQQKFQELAGKRQEQIEELEEQVRDLEQAHEKAARYEKALRGYRDAMLEGVPDSVKTLLKGQDIADQLEWLSANAGEFRPGNGQGSPTFPNTPAPKGAGGLTADEKRRQAYQPRF